MMDTHELLSRAYADERLAGRAGPCVMRQFIVTVIWVCGWERPEGNRWARVAELVGFPANLVWSVFADDAPRYVPPRPDHGREPCEAPGIRKPVCGRRSNQWFRVTNPADGTWRMAGYCDRHPAEARAAQAAERQLRASGTLPEPPPNTGGLLPCYVRWDWEKWYRQARGNWMPPTAGICADDWIPAAAVKVPRLSLIRGDGLADKPPGSPPALTLVSEQE